jgi:hypothetical protein
MQNFSQCQLTRILNMFLFYIFNLVALFRDPTEIKLFRIIVVKIRRDTLNHFKINGLQNN